MQMNLWLIVTLVEGYVHVPVVISSKAIMCEWNQIIAILSKIAIYVYRYIVAEKNQYRPSLDGTG